MRSRGSSTASSNFRHERRSLPEIVAIGPDPSTDLAGAAAPGPVPSGWRLASGGLAAVAGRARRSTRDGDCKPFGRPPATVPDPFTGSPAAATIGRTAEIED